MESTVPIFITFLLFVGLIWIYMGFLSVFVFVFFCLVVHFSFVSHSNSERAHTDHGASVNFIPVPFFLRDMSSELLGGTAADSVSYYLSSLCSSDGRLSGCSAAVMEPVALKWADRGRRGRQSGKRGKWRALDLPLWETRGADALERKAVKPNRTVLLIFSRGIHRSFWSKNWTTGIFSPPLLSQSAFHAIRFWFSDLSPFSSSLTLQTGGSYNPESLSRHAKLSDHRNSTISFHFKSGHENSGRALWQHTAGTTKQGDKWGTTQARAKYLTNKISPPVLGSCSY